MDIYARTSDELAAELDEPRYRGEQVHAWLARGVDDPAGMTDLPVPVRQRLAEISDPVPRIVRRSSADDGLTHKALLDVSGELIESVLMLYPATPQRAGRATVCISTQAGCAMGCPFCATGQAGLRGQLGIGQIVRQVTVMQRLLATGEVTVAGAPDHVTNVVFMGMGEPLANLGPTVAAVRWLHERFGLSARSITVSTIGLVPGLQRLTELGLPLTLAVSLHAPNDELRDHLVPINQRWPLAEVLAAAADYRATTGRRVTYEYVLIEGVNAAPEHARALARLLGAADPGSHVNLIPMNPTPAVPWRAPPPAAQHEFAATLSSSGLTATVRHNRGADIDAACGQLYANYETDSGRVLPLAEGAAARVQPVGKRR